MALPKIKLTCNDNWFIKQDDTKGRGCGTVNDDGHLYLIDENEKCAYQLPDEYKDTPLILYHPCGGLQEGLLMVSLYGEMDLAYHHTFFDVAGMWGWLDLEGNVVIKPQYVYAMSFYGGRAVVCKGDWSIKNGRYWCNNEQWGIIDHSGREIIPCLFDEIFEIDDTRRFILCHQGGWKDGTYCIFDTEANAVITQLDFDFDNGYMFNECFFQDGLLIFDRHEPGEETESIFVYDPYENEWLPPQKIKGERTLNGQTKIVVNKDGQDIIVF